MIQMDGSVRIRNRDYPSIFEAWSPADNMKQEEPNATTARHDLYFVSPEQLGIRWEGEHPGLGTKLVPSTIERVRALREDLLRRNPNMIMMCSITYRDAYEKYLPTDHIWWKRENGKRVPGWEEGGYFQLDFSNAGYRQQVATQAKAMMDSGCFDGVMLDWWLDDEDRVLLVKGVRQAIGNQALILANANDRRTPNTAPYINGYFMECYASQTPADWAKIGDTLRWAEKNLRTPRINCVESWIHQSRQELHLMRSITTLSLTMSDGYALFSDNNELPVDDHLHDWYPFWDAKLGRPIASGFIRRDKAWERSYSGGTAIYNPMGNPSVEVRFTSPRTQISTGKRGNTFQVSGYDGDLFLR
jgi:hypothetical protein